MTTRTVASITLTFHVDTHKFSQHSMRSLVLDAIMASPNLYKHYGIPDMNMIVHAELSEDETKTLGRSVGTSTVTINAKNLAQSWYYDLTARKQPDGTRLPLISTKNASKVMQVHAHELYGVLNDYLIQKVADYVVGELEDGVTDTDAKSSDFDPRF